MNKAGPGLILIVSALICLAAQAHVADRKPDRAVTFNKDIAPILFKNCAPCHRPGGPAPFNLLTFQEAHRRARTIADVTRSRFMPPWLPEPGFGDFLDERRLTDQEIKQIQDWVEASAPEGVAADLPPAPSFSEGWQLGQPDLVVGMPQPYLVGAEGQDLYRNFVLPAPLKEARFVRALEFRPLNRSVHHVRITLDATRQSRRLDEQDSEPGFGGMKTPARFPPGHLLTWVPGKTPAPVPEGLPWTLGKDTDIVLQVHLQRTGKAETIQPLLGLYFTDQPATRTAFLLGISSQSIDIPAGQSNYLVERSFHLPADIEVLSVLPHLHYLGKRVEAFAILPNGKKEWLLLIRDWDFNWQGEYRYKKPLFLPKNSVISMRHTYDNSAANLRNPHQPPRRVYFGPQSTDEMGELWLQVVPRDPKELPALQRAHKNFFDLETISYYEAQLRQNPNDARGHTALGKILGPMGKLEESIRHFQTAIELQPDELEAHYYLGLSLYTIREWADARKEFEAVLRLDPNYGKAHDGLGLIFLKLNQPAQAEIHFQRALEINPDDKAAQDNLNLLRRNRTVRP